MRLSVGTKSLLFGVHQFLWHPWTVGRAWRHIYGRWPTLDQWLCIFFHDIGYLFQPNMDGPEGKRHPEAGAEIVGGIINFLTGNMERAKSAYYLTLYHSSHYARLKGAQPSALYLPDKASILFEPRWWYLLRARLSGEVYEYIDNSPFAGTNVHPIVWYFWYRRKVLKKLNENQKNH